MGVDELLNDEGWCERCLARMLELDPLLDPALARPIVEDMCSRQRWRSMDPVQAAQTVFDYGSGSRGRSA